MDKKYNNFSQKHENSNYIQVNIFATKNAFNFFNFDYFKGIQLQTDNFNLRLIDGND